MNYPGIYAIKNLVSKTVYVGSTHCVSKRRKEHKTALEQGGHPNPHLQNAWNKYGPKAFAFQLLERVDNQRDLRKREAAWLRRFRRVGPVYNMITNVDQASEAENRKAAEQRREQFEKDWQENAARLYAAMKDIMTEGVWARIRGRALQQAFAGDRRANQWLRKYFPYYRNLATE